MINGRSEKTESAPVDFFERTYERFLRAKASAGSTARFYRVGGAVVCLTFAGDALLPYLTPALEHLRVPAAEPDLTLCVWDSRSTSVPMVPPPCARGNITEQGEVRGFNSSRVKLAFHWSDYSVNLLDHQTGTGIYWVDDAGTVPSWERAVPLRTLFHWWLEAGGCQILHAAAVGTDDGAVLLTGRSGKGKSTAALSCLHSGLHYLGDDCVAVRLEPEPFVYSLYCAAKLNAEDIAHFPSLAGLVRNPEEAGKEKQVMFLHPQFKQQIPREMRLKAILLPQIADRNETSIASAPGWKVLRAFNSVSELQLPYVGRRTRDFIRRLSSTVPGYDLDLGRSRKTTPAAIADLLHRPQNAAPAHRSQPPDNQDPSPTPLISVIAAVFNDDRHIRNAVEHSLSQDYPALELVVVDDGSTDRTPEIVSQFPYDIRYVRQEHAGPASARNRGIEEAAGEFLAFLDVHDLWPDGTLRRLVDELLRDPKAGVVHGDIQFVRRNPDKDEYEPIGKPPGWPDFRAAAAVFRKSAFSKAGPFEGTLASARDHDWLARAAESNVRIRRVEAVTLLVRRYHPDAAEAKESGRAGALRLLKETMDRRRAQEARTRGSR